MARAQDINDDARDAGVRLTQRGVGVRVVAAGQLRDLSDECAAFDASALTVADVESNRFSVDSGYSRNTHNQNTTVVYSINE